jgi:hypothetical protein
MHRNPKFCPGLLLHNMDRAGGNVRPVHFGDHGPLTLFESAQKLVLGMPVAQSWGFHLWIRSRGFEEFPDAKPPDQSAAPASGPIELASDPARAVHTVYAIARTRPFISNGRMIYPKPITPQLLAFAQAPPQSEWVWIEGRQQTAAWASFLGAHVTGARPQLVTTRGAERSGWRSAPLGDWRTS